MSNKNKASDRNRFDQKVQNLNHFSLPAGFRGKSGIIVQIWWMVEAFLFRPSPQFMYGWRRWLLRKFGANIGDKVLVRPTVRVTYPWKVKIGHGSWIGDDVVLYSLGEINIGNNAVISQRSYLCTGGHDYQLENFEIFEKAIAVGDEAWIATDVFVAPGINIGRGAVVGARSSVFKDIPPMSVCIGNPAKAIKTREMKS